MQWASAASESSDASAALEECVAALRAARPEPPDIAFLFPSSHHSAEYGRLAAGLKAALSPARILGCSAGAVVGGGREIERRPGLSVSCAWMPGARVHLFHLEQEGMPSPDSPPKAWREWVGAPAAEKPSFLLFCDPFSLDPEELARGLDFAFPGSVKVGGLASGASRPGGNALYLDEKAYPSGAVGAAFTGQVAIDAVVAQGCRPIGAPMKVTRCEKNLLIELGGRPALVVLQELFESLSERDRALARTSLFLGLLGDPLKPEGEFLIRNLLGLDPQSGVLAIGALLRPGQTVRFHLRDGQASAEDLEERLSAYGGRGAARGALLFSCLGRGERLYREPNHDSEAFVRKLGPLALGGFFCNGEIGPVEGTTHLHGFTSCFAIFREVKPGARPLS